jgi:hypothetical protein
MAVTRVTRRVDVAIAALVFLTVAVFAVHKIVAYDVWWQIAAGRWVLDHGFPATDPFSYGLPDRPWIELRWIWCVAVERLSAALGLNALVWLAAALSLGAAALVWITRPDAPLWARTLGVACAVTVAHLRFTIRPELVTFVLLAFTLLALARYRAGGAKWWIFSLPLLQIVWTNAHTLFVLGPVTIWIFAVAEWGAGIGPARRLFGGDRMPAERLWPLFAVAAASTVACLVNPWFLDGALFPLQLFSQIQSGHTLSDIISEFKSPFAYAGFTPFFLRYPLVVAVSAAGFALNRRRMTPGTAAVWAAYLYLSTLSERNLALFGIAAGWATTLNFAEVRGAAWPARVACAALALVAIPAVATNAYYRSIDPSRRFGLGVAEHRFPIAPLELVRTERFPGRTLVNLGDGGYAIHHSGEKSVYVDGRLEVYTAEFVARTIEMFQTGRGLADVAARHDIRTVVVAYGLDGNLFRALNRSPEWTPVYADTSHAVFVRPTEEARARAEALRVDWRAPVARDVAVPAHLAPGDPFEGLWPRVTENVGEKALGQLALLTGALDLARERYAEAHRLRPDDAEARFSLAVISRALGDDAAAARLFTPSEARSVPTLASAATAFAGAGSLESALEALDRAVARGDRDPSLQRLAAVVRQQLRDRL